MLIDDNKSLLLKQRDKLLRRLVDLAVEDRRPAIALKIRIEAENLVTQLNEAEMLLQTMLLKSVGGSAVGIKPIDSKKQKIIHDVVRILKELDRPASGPELTRILAESGYAQANIERSLRSTSMALARKVSALRPLATCLACMNGQIPDLRLVNSLQLKSP